MVKKYEYFIVLLEVFSQRCVFEKECIVTHHSREMQYKGSSLVMKESVHHEKHGFILHNVPAFFCSGYKLFSCEANQHLQTNLIFTLVSLQVDILFCHFPKPPRTQKQNSQRKCFVWTVIVFSRPPGVSLLGSIEVSTRWQCSKLWQEHLYFTII